MTEIPKALAPPKTKVDYGDFKEVTETEAEAAKTKEQTSLVEKDETATKIPKGTLSILTEPIPPSELERVYGKPFEPTLPVETQEQVQKKEPEPEPSENDLILRQGRVSEAQKKMHDEAQRRAQLEKENEQWKKITETLLKRSEPVTRPTVEQKPQFPDPNEDPAGYVESRLNYERELDRRERLYDKIETWKETHPDFIQYWDKMLEIEEEYPFVTAGSNPLNAAYKLAKKFEEVQGTKDADTDWNKSVEEIKRTTLEQEAYKTTQGIRKAGASSKESLLPDLEKMTAVEVWEWLKAHPEYLPEDRIGRRKIP